MSFPLRLFRCFRKPLYCGCNVVRNKGHSKWQNIKETKYYNFQGKNDKLKSMSISRLLDRVRHAVRNGGFDLRFNKDLAAIQQEFRAKSLPLDTFNNYVTKLKSQPEQTVYYEIIGPSGSFFIVETVTDNKNKKTNTFSKYFNKVGGFRFCTGSSIRQAFEEKGIIHVSPFKENKPVSLEEIEAVGIELDCEDVNLVADETNENVYELVCEYTNLKRVEGELKSMRYSVNSANLQLRAKNTVFINPEDTAKVEKFYNFLQEDFEVKQVFDNLEPEVEDSEN
uniref:Transcriptional regulatory protein n=1 Tax=Syphacia muris TaxID=451379 RepID=A0A0N5AKA1_9BILA